MKETYCILLLMASLLICGCSATKDKQLPVAETTTLHAIGYQNGGSSVNALPKAVIYKTNGDYNDHVFINIDPESHKIYSYPAPTDVSSASAPIAIGGGWLLDRRGGIGANSAFLKYTYSQYSELPHAPSLQELKESIIPGAHVTVIKVLPINAMEAAADPTALRQYIND